VSAADGTSRRFFRTCNKRHYAAAKGAIASLTYAAATDWGQHGITANVIYPAILTPSLKAYLETQPEQRAQMEAQVPVRYVGDPLDDLGPIVLFLASDASAYLTGHPFFVKHGSSRRTRPRQKADGFSRH
jgi:NAD(P)-dependent dehydrogenase (short-subunit alcohol dehydrogenase family)